jgi:D-xylose transport system permease protein
LTTKPETAAAQPVIEVERETLFGLLRGYFDRLRGGDVGLLPVLVGLGGITLYFWSKNHVYVSAVNFNNLVAQMAGVAIIAMGVVFVLLLGEIDLSVGYVAGVGGVTVALLQQPDTSHQFGPFTIHQVAGLTAILLAVAVGAAIGAFQGSFVALIGVPSFVVTLAGLLAWQGVVQRGIGDQGVITIQSNTVNDVANYLFSERAGWTLAGIAAVGYAASVLFGVISRRRAGLRAEHPVLLLLKVLVVAALSFFVVGVCNRAGGVPFPGVLVAALLIFWTYIAARTTFGRHVYAVGGNAEAARRAGISVKRIRILVFMISSAMAAIGGIILAANVNSVDLNFGGGTLLLNSIAAAVIGGVSLFGGRGEVRAAFLGALVIATVSNGLNTAGYATGVIYVVTGVILLLAVTLDTIGRRLQVRAGR